MSGQDTFQVKVRLFAILAEIAGKREIDLTVPKDATGYDLLSALTEKYPELAPLAESLRLAANLEYVPLDHRLAPDDDLALIPPVSGGAGDQVALPYVEVTKVPLSVERYQSLVVSPECGAVCLFVGVVREVTGDKITLSLQYEAYEEMAVNQMRKVAAQMLEKWPMARIALGHRVGHLGINEASVVVAVATPHRAESFEAARFGIDTLKEQVPIWKKEIYADGEVWVGIDA